MDYDDNDFQSQNFHLIGEENNKFPSGLRSFSLPKFDLDEHLQVHLRFDSVVEADALLGIQSQEEGNWIEGFSAGSGAIEFSSSAAETCSISRHNNVWSEATSSESVEMLLNSVGEDEKINKQVEESFARDGLHSINDHMDPSLTQDDSLHSKVHEPVNVDTALPPDKCERNFSSLNKNVTSVLLDVEATHQTSKGWKGGSGSSVDLDENSNGEKLNSCGRIVSVQCGSNEKLTSQSCIDPVMHSGNQSNRKFVEQIPEGYAGDALHVKLVSLQTGDQKEESRILHKGNVFSDRSSEGHAVMSTLGDPENASRIDPKPDLKVLSEPIYSGKPDEFLDEISDHMKISRKGGDLRDQILPQMQETSFSALNMDLVQGREGSADFGFHEKPEGIRKYDSIHVESMVSIEASGRVGDISGRELEMSIVVMEEKQDTESQLIGSNSNGVSSSSSLSAKVCNVPSITHEPQATEIKEDDGSMEILLPNFTSENPDSAVFEKSAEVLLDTDDRSFESSLNSTQEVMLENSRLAATVYSPANCVHEEQVTGVQKNGTNLDVCLPDVALPAVEEIVLANVALKDDIRNSEDSSSKPGNIMQENAQAIDSNSLGNSEVQMPFSMNTRSWEACHEGALEPDPCGIRMVSSEVSVLEEECKKSSLNSDNLVSHSEIYCEIEKTEDTSLQGQNTVAPPAAVDGLPAKEIIQVYPDEVVEQKELTKSHLSASASVRLDRNEEKISSEPCLSDSMGNANSQAASGPDLFSDPDQNNLSSPLRLQSTMIVQPASSMEKSVQVTCQNSAELVVHSVSSSAAEKEGESKEVDVPPEQYEGASLKISGKIACGGEVAVNKQQDGKDNLVPGDGCCQQNLATQTESDAVVCLDAAQSGTLSRRNAESAALEPDSENCASNETSCGSPTVISSSGHSHGDTVHREVIQNSSDRIVTDSGYCTLICLEKNKNHNEAKSIACESKENNAPEDDRSFTFEVGSLPDLSERDSGSGWKPFPSVSSFVLPQSREGTSTTSNLYQSDIEVLKEISHGSHLGFGGGVLCGVDTKNADKDKNRSLSGNGSERATGSKRKPSKDAPIGKQTPKRGGNPCSTTGNTVGVISRDKELEEMRPYSYMEGSGMKPPCTATVQTSNLPDLNTATSAAVLFHQPFTDSQQVQLRAQIFVYGSLIQGIPPDDACMISAFGDTDGGRRLWEGVWHVAAERFYNQKSLPSTCETPLRASSGIKAFDQATRCSPLYSKYLNPPASRTGNKGSPSTSSTMSIPLPLWSVSSPRDILHSNMARALNMDSNQVLSPLHAYQSPQIRPYTGNGIPWPSLAPCPAPWIGSSQTSALGTSTQISAVPIAETGRVTSTRESSSPCGSNLQPVTPSAFPNAKGLVSVSAASAVQIETNKKLTSSGPGKKAAADQKSRKRKKVTMPNALGQEVPVSQTDMGSSTEAAVHTSVGLSSPSKLSNKVTPTGIVSTASPIMSPTHFQIIATGGPEQKVIFSEETCSKIEQAKQQADDAAAFAASAAGHRDCIWSQLAIQRNSGFVSDTDGRLASAAVAAAAAAAVAKAAAAAAKVASDAALQAKMMADEAIILNKMGNSGKNSETGYHDGGSNLGSTSPVSLLKGKDVTNCSGSIISAAREVARSRVEAASAATKRAENLDAIVKAAELAAEAVSQAGAIIAMGEPLPFTLNDLVEAGPESYWKAQCPPAEQCGKENSMHRKKQVSVDITEGLARSVECFNQQSSNQKEILKTTEGGKSSARELSRQTTKNHTGEGSGIASSAVPTGRHENEMLIVNLKENRLQEGSLVEVSSEEDNLRGIWCSARVLNLKDDKAYVCYNEPFHDKGSGKLMEWIPLEGNADKAPRIRIAHPNTAANPEGTRKRRREAAGNYIWSVGDMVDARIRDGWREGNVIDKSKEDETILTVHFPAKGDSSVVKAWDVRPSLIWKDGQWVEWESSFQAHEGDTPQEKRQKLGRLEGMNDSKVEVTGGDKLSANLQMEDQKKLGESRPLGLSLKDTIFSVGKNVRENISDSLRIKRTGLQKEGSRVTFGVPKPGKKRKFMEVSKHYVADKTNDKMSEGNYSLKFAKYLMPQTSRGWKNSSKIDPKGKQAGDSKPKVLKSSKSQTKKTTDRESSSMSVVSFSNGGGSSQVSLPNVKASNSHEENKLGQNLRAGGSYPESLRSAEDLTLVPQLLPVPGVPSSKKSASAVETELRLKGKNTFAKEKSVKNEEKGSSLADDRGKIILETIEPRRSNRRIQPTSRLLEGLQSSLIIGKIPNLSHDRSAKIAHRSVSSSRGNAHG